MAEKMKKATDAFISGAYNSGLKTQAAAKTNITSINASTLSKPG